MLERLTQVRQNVPRISDVLRTRCSLSPTLSVCSTAITAHDLDARVRSQPGGQCLGSSIGQEVHPTMALQIDQNRAVGATSAQRKIINAKHTRRLD